MIPDRVIEILSGPSFVQIATRDESLRPAHTYAVGALVHEDRQTVTVLVPTARAARILGVDRRTLYRLIERLRPPQPPPGTT